MKQGPPHGTYARYLRLCRCAECRKANADYHRELRQHGYVGPHVVAGVCFAIGTFFTVLLLLGGPGGAWR